MTKVNRSFRSGPHRTTLSAIILLVVVSLRLLYLYSGRDENQGQPEVLIEGSYDVVRVVDGDTLIVRLNRDALASNTPDARLAQIRLRLLSIDTPETTKPGHPPEPWGKEATRFTKQFVRGGVVRLRFDKRRRDQYGRWLAYVYVGDQMLNQEIVRAGLARVIIYRGDSMTIGRQLERSEREARKANRGIWSERDI